MNSGPRIGIAHVLKTAYTFLLRIPPRRDCRCIFNTASWLMPLYLDSGWKSVLKRRDSDGNLVYVGKFDADGANVNRNRPDNSNDDLGVAFSRSLCPGLLAGVFFFFGISFFHPATEHSPNFMERFFKK